MDKTNVIVWLLSAVSIISWWSIVNYDVVEKWKDSFLAFFRNVGNVKWLSKILAHLAFYGLGFSGFIGFEKDSVPAYIFAVYWFFLFLSFSYSLVKQEELLESSDYEQAVNSIKEKKDV